MSKIMENMEIIREKIPSLVLRTNESLSRYTSFKIGGCASVMAFPQNEQELSDLLNLTHEQQINPVILGAGTNVLVPDEGIDNLIICLKDSLNGMQQIDTTAVRIMAGVTMSRAAAYAAGLGLSGLEFAHGIPGSIGGGIYMNAGAYGGEIKDVCRRVRVSDYQGNCKWLESEELEFSYRNSWIQTHGLIVISADFQLTRLPETEIRNKMKELMNRRKKSQPLELPSAGSAFKRPQGGYAAELIEKSGLKGYRVGNAAVSSKHAGFIVNLGGATAKDVRTLIKQVSDIVFEKTGIRLEPEVRIW